ncbi:FecR family protein [Dawidia soli]|uniref:DUF4974 domain-containing protein n=1 Tax=Dawidia soli TaxID=2782352 RepID=A0AAP2D6C3_9BACT|nr:FecR domain-containing protein [Dawidia soli]MBT1686133.1 DUF4974 domain-containing protein [Dawidia soli]
MHYKDYTVEDFIQDEYFQQWVSSPNEALNQYWDSFLRHYPQQAARVAEARQFLEAMNFKRPVSDAYIENMRFDMNRRIDELEQNTTSASITPAATTPRRRRILYCAAAASILLAAAVFGYRTWMPAGISLATSHAWNEQRSLKGEKVQITLGDGTTVWLNGESTLRYANDFAHQDLREVYLEGEAFFDVAENKHKPFIVHTSDIAIRVLGTAFNVKSYLNDKSVETTLVRGKVSIANQNTPSREPVTLLPNQQATFSKKSQALTLAKAVNTEKYTAWREGWIVFDDLPFSDIKATLERWYNVSIDVQSEHFGSCTFSGKFQNKSLEEILAIFQNTASITYRLEGNRVLITGGSCEE